MKRAVMAILGLIFLTAALNIPSYSLAMLCGIVGVVLIIASNMGSD